MDPVVKKAIKLLNACELDPEGQGAHFLLALGAVIASSKANVVVGPGAREDIVNLFKIARRNLEASMEGGT